MSVPEQRLQTILLDEGDVDRDRRIASVQEHRYVEVWSIIDGGALVIYDAEDPPSWLPVVDEDGNTEEYARRGETVASSQTISRQTVPGKRRRRQPATTR